MGHYVESTFCTSKILPYSLVNALLSKHHRLFLRAAHALIRVRVSIETPAGDGDTRYPSYTSKLGLGGIMTGGLNRPSQGIVVVFTSDLMNFTSILVNYKFGTASYICSEFLIFCVLLPSHLP